MNDPVVPCVSCRYENRVEARFCGGCGRALQGELLCRSCRTSNLVGSRYCDACGLPLTLRAASRPALRTDGWRQGWVRVARPLTMLLHRLGERAGSADRSGGPLVSAAGRLILVTSALLLGILAQTQFAGHHVGWGVVLGVSAMVAAGFAVRGLSITSSARMGPTSSKSTDDSREQYATDPGGGALPSAWLWSERHWGVGAMLLGASLSILSLYLFPKGPPNTLAWYCYGASVVLAIVALPALEGRWTGLVDRLRLGGWSVSFELPSLLPWAALGAILIFALLIRLYDLDVLPAGLYFDEAVSLEKAMLIAEDPGRTPVFVPSTAVPSLILMPIALVIKLAGVSITTVRLISVAFGLVGVVAVFLLTRSMLGTWIGLFAAFLTAVMRWDLNFSRIGLIGITTPFFAALAAYLTLRAVRSGRVSDFSLAGASLGVGMWFYAPFRFFPVVLALMLLHTLVFMRSGRRRLVANIAVMTLAAFVAAAPVAQYAITDSEVFLDRTRVTSIFTDTPLDEAIDQARESLVRHMLMFHVEGDQNGRHNLPGAPMLDFLSGVLMLLGLGVVLSRWRDASLIALPLWVFVMMLPGVLTLAWEAPQSLRSIGAIPAVVLLVALGLGAIWTTGRSSPWPLARRATVAVVGVLLAAIAFANIDTYFGAQARDPRVFAAFSTDERLMSEHMVEQIRRGYAILVSRQLRSSIFADLLSNDPRREVIAAPASIPLGSDRVWLGASIYLEPREVGVFHLLKTYYPDGHFREVRAPSGGNALYYSAVISREQMDQVRGLISRRILADGSVIESRGSGAEGVWIAEPGVPRSPFDFEWEGALHVTEPGEYALTLEGNTTARVYLNGVLVLSNASPSVRISPAVGVHGLEVAGRVEDDVGVLRLLWQPPGGEMSSIPLGNLYHGTVRPVGLAGRFFKNPAGPAPDAVRVTATIGSAFWYDPVVEEPYIAVWEGSIDIPGDGEYRFRLKEVFGEMRLLIDGELVARTGGSIEGETRLTQGERQIRLEYVSSHPPSRFEVLWAPPGEPEGPLPIERLSPMPERMIRVVGGS